MDRDIFKKIKKTRVKLDSEIEKKGLHSPEVRKLSDRMDELVNEYNRSIQIVEYPKDSTMILWYEKSYKELKKITSEFGKFPFVEEWNLYAKNNNLLSHASLEYISRLNWNYLRVKVLRELNMEI